MRDGFESFAFYPFLLLAWMVWATLPSRQRPWGLTFASLVFVVALGRPLVLMILVLLTLSTWLAGRMAARKDTSKRFWIAGGIGIALAALLTTREILSQNTGWALGGALGVSYFSLQAVGYLADLGLDEQDAEPSLMRIWLYLSWFPKFVQGPFERFGAFQTELDRSTTGPRAEDLRRGLLLIAWGLFEKMVVAERAAAISNGTFQTLANVSGPQVWGATYVFMVQLFADFAGYTDIALGVSALFGWNLSPNFNAPFLADSVADFWNRWHITLSEWMRDYVFIPLQHLWRNRPSASTLGAVAVTFFLVGWWHGNGLGYILMGILQTVWISLAFLTRSRRKSFWKTLRLERSIWRRIFDVIITLQLSALTFLCFRAGDKAGVFSIGKALLRGWDRDWPAKLALGLRGTWTVGEAAAFWCLPLFLVAVHIASRQIRLLDAPAWLRYPAYTALAAALLLLGRFFNAQGFIYARF